MPTIFIPRLIRAQSIPLPNLLSDQIAQQKSASGGGIVSMSDDFDTGGTENPIGSPWLTGATNCGTFTNVMAQTSGGKAEGNGSNSAAYVNPALFAFSGNHKASVTIDNPNACGPIVRAQAGTSKCYVAYIFSSTGVAILKYDVSAGEVELGSDFTVTAIVADDVVSLEATGTGTVTLTLRINGVSQGTRTDSSSAYSGGQPGMFSNGFTAFRAFSATDI